jgi:hypothetical protein
MDGANGWTTGTDKRQERMDGGNGWIGGRIEVAGWEGDRGRTGRGSGYAGKTGMEGPIRKVGKS